MSWYDDLNVMLTDDIHLQRNVKVLKDRLCSEAQERLRDVHVYPSQRCTYTVDKRRVFVCPRDAFGAMLSDCALQHVIMHEFAHVLNHQSIGHGVAFERTMKELGDCLEKNASDVSPCPEGVPKDYNVRCSKKKSR